MKVLGLILMLALIVGCDTGAYPHRFHRGDCAIVVLTGDRAMVVRTLKYYGTVQVRLGRAGKSSSGLLGPTVKSNEYLAVKSFQDFELDECPAS